MFSFPIMTLDFGQSSLIIYVMNKNKTFWTDSYIEKKLVFQSALNSIFM